MFNQDLNWKSVVVLVVPLTTPNHPNLDSQVFAIRFALYLFDLNKSSKNTCQMLPHLMPQRQESLEAALPLPSEENKIGAFHRDRMKTMLHWKHQSLHIKPKTNQLQIKLKKVIVSVFLRLFQYNSSSSGLSRWGRCLRCLQDTALRSCETFTGFKTESFSRQSKMSQPKRNDERCYFLQKALAECFEI